MSVTLKRDLGARIRAARRIRLNGMTLQRFAEEVAKRMGRTRPFSNVTVSNWETGRQEPSWAGLIAIAQATGLPLEYFAGIGALEDYPARDGASEQSGQLTPQLQSLMAGSQRLDTGEQRIMLGQVEALLDTLRQQERFEGTAARRG